MNETTNANDAIHRGRSGDASPAGTHGQRDHAEAAHEDHAAGAPLGPIDWRAWAAGILGVGAGLVVAVCLYAATNS